MPNDVDGFLSTLGDIIPEAPKGQRIALYTVRLTQDWWEIVQSIANDARHPYDGDVGAVFRHGLLFAAKFWMNKHATGEPNPVAWMLEVEGDKKNEEALKTFQNLVAKRVKEAETFGGGRAGEVLWSLVGTIKKYPVPHVRVQMTEYLLACKPFVRAVRKVMAGHEHLAAWMEALS